MTGHKPAAIEDEISRDRLADLLNEDLAREYQAIIAYVVYSQVLSGAQYMGIAAQLEIHAKQELDHALILARQIDYLGKMPVVTPKPVRTSKNPEDMLRYDLDNENETIRNYRDRVRQCEALVCTVKRRRFPVGASPTRRPLQPEATEAGMEGTKCLKPSDSGSRNTVTARVCRPQRE